MHTPSPMTDSSAAPLALEPVGADLDKCLVYSRLDIASLLSQLCKQGVMFTATIGAGAGSEGNFILTSLLAVRSESNQLIAEFGANADANRRALSAARLNFVAMHEGIKIQFSAQPVSQTRLHGREAFVMPLPTSLLRLQRREFFRVTAPAQSLKCIMGAQGPAASAGGAGYAISVVDIGCGGVGVNVTGAAGELEAGSLVPGCRIVLPGAAEVRADMVIKSVQTLVSRGGTLATRVGYQFVEIAERDRASIQRYINRVERDRNRLR